MRVLVPKTAVHEYHKLPRSEDNIWISWKIIGMETKTKAKLVKQAPNDQLRLGIGLLIATHREAGPV